MLAVQRTSRGTQIFRPSSIAARGGLVDQFRLRNGPAWTAGGDRGQGLSEVDGYRGYLRFLWKRGACGAAVGVTEAQALKRARAMVARNADLLGLPAGAEARLKSAVQPNQREGSVYPDTAFFVTFTGTHVQPGFEVIDLFESEIRITVGVDDDGEIRFIGNHSRLHPELTLNPLPKLDRADPRVTASVLREELATFRPVPEQVGHRYVPDQLKTSLGRVQPEDIRAIRSTLFVQRGESGTKTYVVAYQLEVQKAGHLFHFVVDASTGEVLDRPRKPLGARIIEELS